jgi:hypothetical protein
MPTRRPQPVCTFPGLPTGLDLLLWLDYCACPLSSLGVQEQWDAATAFVDLQAFLFDLHQCMLQNMPQDLSQVSTRIV